MPATSEAAAPASWRSSEAPAKAESECPPSPAADAAGTWLIRCRVNCRQADLPPPCRPETGRADSCRAGAIWSTRAYGAKLPMRQTGESERPRGEIAGGWVTWLDTAPGP